ncbi:hypothetical protein Avbf_12439 [Armadillidium vulgare]|nr:hypothetical protein Avbf_12439 [Armadillidium vulgare]
MVKFVIFKRKKKKDKSALSRLDPIQDIQFIYKGKNDVTMKKDGIQIGRMQSDSGEEQCEFHRKF